MRTFVVKLASVLAAVMGLVVCLSGAVTVTASASTYAQFKIWVDVPSDVNFAYRDVNLCTSNEAGERRSQYCPPLTRQSDGSWTATRTDPGWYLLQISGGEFGYPLQWPGGVAHEEDSYPIWLGGDTPTEFRFAPVKGVAVDVDVLDAAGNPFPTDEVYYGPDVVFVTETARGWESSSSGWDPAVQGRHYVLPGTYRIWSQGWVDGVHHREWWGDVRFKYDVEPVVAPWEFTVSEDGPLLGLTVVLGGKDPQVVGAHTPERVEPWDWPWIKVPGEDDPEPAGTEVSLTAVKVRPGTYRLEATVPPDVPGVVVFFDRRQSEIVRAAGGVARHEVSLPLGMHRWEALFEPDDEVAFSRSWAHVDVLVLDQPPAPEPPTVTPAAPVLKLVKAPKVTGKAKVGKTLTASKGTWRSTDPKAKVTVKFQWQNQKGKKAVNVKKATKSTLKLTKKLKGKKVRVRVTVSAPGHKSVVHVGKWSKKVA